MWSKKIKSLRSPMHIGLRVLKRYYGKKVQQKKLVKQRIKVVLQKKNKYKIGRSESEVDLNKLLINKELQLLSNGFAYVNDEQLRVSVTGTCAFDSLTQILYSVATDIELYKRLFEAQNDHPYFSFILYLINNGIRRETYIKRSEFLLNNFSQLVRKNNSSITLSAVCNILEITKTLVSPTMYVEYKCSKNCSMITKSILYLGIEYFEFTELDFKTIQDRIRLPYATCKNCDKRIAKRELKSYNGIVIVDVEPLCNSTVYSVKIEEIQQHLSILDETVFLKGIINYHPPSTDGSIGHYTAYINRPNGQWECHDDLAKFICKTNSRRSLNPAILIYTRN